MKKIKLIMLIIGGSIAFSYFLFAVTGAFAIFMPEPPEPQIKYGEFPFTITYEINNEIKTYEDAVICEYEGTESWGTAGKVRKWSSKLKSGNEYIVILESNTDDLSYKILLRIPGSAQYYMGDFGMQSKEDHEHTIETIRPFMYMENDYIYRIETEDVWKKYGIRFISLEYSQPVENQFIEKD